MKIRNRRLVAAAGWLGTRAARLLFRTLRFEYRPLGPSVAPADLPPGEAAKLSVRRGAEALALDLVPEPDEGADPDGVECDRWDATFQVIRAEETPTLHFWSPRGVYVLSILLFLAGGVLLLAALVLPILGANVIGDSTVPWYLYALYAAYFLAIFSSASFATMSGPADAGFTVLSMWRILPSGPM